MSVEFNEEKEIKLINSIIREAIVQAKGKFNRDTTEEENKVVEEWNKKFSNKREEMAA